MTINCLRELLRFHRDIGGITHDELKELFDEASPLIDDVINSWEDDVIKNRSSFFLAVEAYGVLMSKAGELTLHEITTELDKKHEGSGEPRIVITPQSVREALEILASLGAITKRGIEYYKALLSSEVFLLRLQKMCGLVCACRGKFRPILLCKGVEKYLK